MKSIKQRLILLIVTSSLGLLSVIIILFKDGVIKRLHTDPFLVLAILLTVILFGFLLREYRVYKTAGLIVENKIIHIQVAQIEDEAIYTNNTPVLVNGIEVFISCFGILLDSRVIKFNIDGVKLKVVEIGHGFICLSYGTDEKTQKIRILSGNISRQELQVFVERFRYETGVVPVASDL